MSDNPLLGLISESFVFALETIFLSYLLFGDKQMVKFFFTAYMVKLFVGIAHYLIFVDPDYFQTTGEAVKFHHEFQAVRQSLQMIIEGKYKYGVLSVVLPEYVPHEQLLNIIAIPLFYSGNYILNIAPISSFFSSFAAMNILIVDRQMFRFANKDTRYIKYFLAYFPMTLISSYYSRDMAGWGLMSIGLVLMYLPQNMLVKTIMLPLSCYLFYLQRNAYALVPIVTFFIWYQITGNKNLFIKILAILICVVSFPFAYILFETESTLAYVDESTKWPIYLLPIKFFVGLIGAFPWSNFVRWKTTVEVSYYLMDYLMSILNIGILITLIKALPIRSFVKTLDFSFIIGIVLFLFGLMNSFMHMTYISVGIFFMMPWFFRVLNVREILNNLKLAFILLVLLNFFVVLTGISGVSSSVR